uniref:DNA polymerase n=1 Tax=Poriella subacida TaxID=2872513 RepID=UPI003001C5B1|nr:DNA polymerase [Poriella subacida]
MRLTNYKIKLTQRLIRILIRVSMVIDQLTSMMKSNSLIPYNPRNHALVPYESNKFELDHVQINPEGRYLEFIFTNKELLPLFECLQSMFSILQSNDQFKQLSNKKIIITHIGGVVTNVSGYDETVVINLHKNIIIDNYTTFNQYYSKIKSDIKPTYHSLYGFEIPNTFYVKVWKADHLMNKTIYRNTKVLDFKNRLNNIIYGKRSFSTSTRRLNFDYLSNITQLKKQVSSGKNFYTLDIETVNVKGFQQPIIVTFSNGNSTQGFTVNNVSNEAVIDLWMEFFEYLFKNVNGKNNIIYTHNLGGFDGIFIHKITSKLFDDVETIIDDAGKYILIKVNYNNVSYIFKDSLRLFPVSLNELCKVFNVPGKLESYKSEWNNVKVLNNPDVMTNLIKYAKQDVIALHSAIKNAQLHFISKYGVDITSILSLPSLALKIFRSKFLQQDIPILNNFNDNYVRKSYYGGAVDIYQAYAQNAYYYDKNSLYPEGMCELMPLSVIETLIQPINLDLDNFFGFLDVDIECPTSIKRPILPFKHEGRTIFPQGIFNGVYFSEELKEAIKLGYKIIKIHSAKRFSSNYLFNDYVKEMYNLKAVSKGAERWIAKLLLNSLYGIFGRKQETIKTITIDNSNLESYLVTHTIKNIIPIDNDKSILLIIDKVNIDLLNELNNHVEDNDKSIKPTIKSNVAIAAAITAYARIKMIPYKIMDGAIYTDTDSIITTTKLDDSLIGSGLGQMKDELSGSVMKEILVLGCKQYGYYFFKEGERFDKSVWAGITRNSLTFNDLLLLFKGNIISRI